MSQLFLKLGFVTQGSYEADQLHLANIWKCIGGDSDGQKKIPLKRVKNFMNAI